MTSVLAFALVIVAAPAGVTEPIPTGTWINENPVAVGLQTSFRPAASSGCPKGMAPTGAYKCLEVVKDGSGHGVMIRYGQSGDSGFGYLHMFIDHTSTSDPRRMPFNSPPTASSRPTAGTFTANTTLAPEATSIST